MSQNPLQHYFRQPKIFISLPSRGVYSKPGTIEGDPNNIAVYGMTGMDEIIIKTPDALLSGESTAKVIQSCVPAIKNAWDISVLDTDLIFAAIRIATYGNLLSVSHTCSKCETENDYDLDLNRVIEHFAVCNYDNKVVVGDLIIKLQPLNYKQRTEFNIRNYELQQKLAQAEKIENPEEQQRVINTLWDEFAVDQKRLYAAIVESVETPDQTVEERGHIVEWLDNCDSMYIDAIKKHIAEHQKEWNVPTFPVKCTNCGNETDLSVELDYSNFFG